MQKRLKIWGMQTARNGGRRLWSWGGSPVLQIQLVINPARLSIALTFGEWIPGKFLFRSDCFHIIAFRRANINLI
jgi:hypothetical protein